MNDTICFAIAACLASIMTWIELDKKFYVPTSIGPWIRLKAWWWGFIILNGILAGSLFLICDFLGVFKENIPHAFLRAALIGVGYLALIRLKIGTVQTSQGEVSAGFEAIYDGAKSAFYERINRIVLQIRAAEAIAKTQLTIDELVKEAKTRIASDRLIEKRKPNLKKWIFRLQQGTEADEFDRKLALAVFILSGDDDGDVQ